MESPGLYADGNLDGDEVVSCKGCGEVSFGRREQAL